MEFENQELSVLNLIRRSDELWNLDSIFSKQKLNEFEEIEPKRKRNVSSEWCGQCELIEVYMKIYTDKY